MKAEKLAINPEKWITDLENIVTQKSESEISKCGPSEITVLEEKVIATDEYILGFKVIDKKIEMAPKTIPNPLLEKIAKVKDSLAKRNTFKMALNALDVEPIAILPSKVWEKICQECKLYRFENFHADRRSVDADVQEVFGMAQLTFILLPIVLNYVSALTTCLITHVALYKIILLLTFSPIFFYMFFFKPIRDLENEKSVATVLVITGIVTLISPVIIFGTSYITVGMLFLFLLDLVLVVAIFKNKSIQTVAFRICLYLVPNRLLISLLWSSKIDKPLSEPKADDNDIELIQRVTPFFPTPNLEFKSLLLKLKANYFKLNLAAEPMAIKISRQELYGKVAKIVDYQETHDPIVYIKSDDGQNVAILGQFGKFSQEKKAIALVKAMTAEDLF